MEQEELGICHTLQLHGRVRHIELILPLSTFHNIIMLMNKHFPTLEHLSLSFVPPVKNSLPLMLPKAFLAPNLLRLALVGIGLPKRLQALTSTVSLVTLELSNIQTSNYFRPRLLVARLQSLPQLQELSVEFSTPIPRPSTQRELLGEQRTPVTLPSLKKLQFKGVNAYMESLVAQIRAPLLRRLEITLFNQIAFELPHLSDLINITDAIKLPSVAVGFDRNEVYVTAVYRGSGLFDLGPFLLRVMCKQLDWQIDCAAQICNALIPALSLAGLEQIRLTYLYKKIPTEWQNGAIDGTTWHELLRSFIGVKELHIYDALLEELSRELQVDEIGLDPEFLPNLQSIHAVDNLFTPFIETRQVVGRPVQFSQRGY